MYFTKLARTAALLAVLLSPAMALADYGPMYTCPGPYACVLPSYLGVKFADGTTQTTAAVSDGAGGILNSVQTNNGSGALQGDTKLIWNGTTLAVTGAATVSTTLGVTGNATVGGTLGVTGDLSESGNILVTVLGKGHQVKTGANSKIGHAACGATVTNTSLTANSHVMLTRMVDGGTVVAAPWVTAQTVATSFVVTCSAGDTSTIGWYIVEELP